MLAGAGCLFAQTQLDCPSPDRVSRYCAVLVIKNGLTAREISTLNPGSNRFPADTKEKLDSYLDKALPLLGKPYRMILSESDRKKDDAGTLDNPNRAQLLNAGLSLERYSEPLQAWCDSYDDCEAAAAVVLGPAGLYKDFAKYHDAPLIFDAESDVFNAETGMVAFRVPAPFDSKTVQIRIPGLPAGREQRRIQALKSWVSGLDHGLFLRDPIVKRLTSFYDGLGLDPEVSVLFDGPQPSISIMEGSRIRSIGFPYGLPVKDQETDWRKTEIALYSVLRDSDFRKGYLANRAAIQERLDKFETPVLDFQEDLNVAAQDLPYASRLRIPVQQLLVRQNGFSLAVTSAIRRVVDVPGSDGKPTATNFSFVDLRLEEISQAPQTEGAPVSAPAPTDVMGKVDPHLAETLPQPAFANPIPARTLDRPGYCLDDAKPAKPKNGFVGVGGQYLPGQGLRAFGLTQKSELPIPFMNAEASIRAGMGGNSTALATASFAADYIAFEQIHHRVSFTFQGGQDSLSNRFLFDRKLDEHRRGGMARGEFEWFRDRRGHLLKFFAEGHHDTVLLSKDGIDNLKRNLTTIDFGAVHLYQSSDNPFPWTLRLEPVFRVAPRTANVDNFARGGLGARFQRALRGHFSLHFAGRYEQASEKTPEFELPSLGGDESVRGFRRDDALGQRLWSLQNELWTPVPFLQKLEFVRENLRLAGFFDAGNAHRKGAENPGIRRGAGLGARMTFGPVVLKGDVAYGFGEAATHSRRLKLYFGATMNLPI